MNETENQETVEVTIKVPKHIMKILENEKYLGWRKNDFYVASIIANISCEASAMDFNKMKALETKYGKHLGSVCYEKVEGLKVLRKAAS